MPNILSSPYIDNSALFSGVQATGRTGHSKWHNIKIFKVPLVLHQSLEHSTLCVQIRAHYGTVYSVAVLDSCGTPVGSASGWR